MKPWKFTQKTIGYGIAKEAYWSVLAGSATLPPLLALVNPSGEGGAVEGFLAPLGAGASKEDLGRPLARGNYVLSSKDRKTVLLMTVLNPQEAGYDPAPVLNSAFGATLSPEVRARIGATWFLVQMRFESHHPMVIPSLVFLLSFLKRLSELTNGLVADAFAMTYKLPEEVFVPDPVGEIDVRDHISITSFADSDGIRMETNGFRKFALQDFEITSLRDQDRVLANNALCSISQFVLEGNKALVGQQFGDPTRPLQLAAGTLRSGGIQKIELIPVKGTLSEALEYFRG